MPVSTVTYTANGSTNQFSITFPYIDAAHVLVSVNGSSASFTFHNSTTVQLSSTPTSGQTVVVYRQTPSSALVDFTDGSTLFESDLDLANTQARYLSEEARDRADSAITTVTANKANIDTVAGIAGNVTTVAGISGNVATVAGDAAEIAAVAGKTTEITALGTSANIANMATLGASGVVADIATVAGVAPTMTAAASNASAAAASASAAANSAAAAAASFDTFDDRYLGSKSSEPSVDNDGNALISGSLFFDSAVGSMKVFDGGNWILATSAGAASLLDYEYTATAGQTTFTGADNNSATLSYTAGNLIVTLNGIVLDNGSDYTATSGTSIVLASGAALNDHLAVVAFKSFTVADTVAASTGGTFAGGVTVSGTITATSAQVNGNIAVTGTVDGRDVSADGTKLDTNIPSSLGAAGQVLTVNPAGNAGAWVAASGGGEQEFTASGSITAGQPVGINPNGTIGAMSANQSGLLSGGSSNTSAKPQMDYDTNANKLVICTQGPPSGYSSYVEIVDPAADLTATFGTPVVSRSSNTDSAYPAFDPATGRTNILFVAQRSNTQWLYAVSGIVSGTSMTFGSEATGTYNGNGDISNPAFINAGSNKSVVVARQYQSGNYQSHVYVLTTSGTSISFGSPVLLDSSGGFDTAHRHGAVYDSNADKVVIFYQEPNQASYAKVGTISGTSISFGSRVTLSSSTFRTANEPYYPCFDTNSNKVVLATTNSITNKPSVIVGTVSGTSISFGTPVVINDAAADASQMHAAFDSSTNTVLISYFVSSGDAGYWLQKVKVNGTSVDVGDKISLSSNSISGPVRYADDIDRIIALKTYSGGSFAITNPSAPTYVGLAKENISNGAAGKVTVAGGINESQSSLVTGFPYGLSPTSSTIAVGPSNKIGTALSATKIYLSEGSI